MTPRTAIVLLNIGSPSSAQTKDVRQYLTRFLTDARVIDLPSIPRWMLVNLIIAPFRSSHSAKLYKQLWTEEGAPLVYYAQQVKSKLQAELNQQTTVFVGMSYGEPLIAKTLKTIQAGNFSRLVVVPLFPQYASSSSGAAIEAVMNIVRKWAVIPEIHVVNQFYNHPLFIDAFASRIRQYNYMEYDHILFSYHGLPMRHLQKMCTVPDCDTGQAIHPEGSMCYHAACIETTRLLANELNIAPTKYSIGFQSQMTKDWMQPFTNKVIVAKARQGVKNMLVVAPSFVADCLETTVELGFTYKKMFQENGGKNLQLVESLNDSPIWIEALKQITGKFL